MSAVKKPSVLVCVTGQYDCDRLIEAGFEQAVELGAELHVLCVHPPVRDLSYAKDLGADMTLLFSDKAPQCAAGFARKINARHLITGLPDNRPNGFVLTLSELLPRLQITMVTKEGENLLYRLDNTDRALA